MINNKYNPSAYKKYNENTTNSGESGKTRMAGTHYTDAFSKRFSDPRMFQPPQLRETTHDESWVKYQQLLSELFPDEIDED